MKTIKRIKNKVTSFLLSIIVAIGAVGIMAHIIPYKQKVWWWRLLICIAEGFFVFFVLTIITIALKVYTGQANLIFIIAGSLWTLLKYTINELIIKIEKKQNLL